MAKRVRLASVERLERQQAELAQRVRTAKDAQRARKKAEDARRHALLGSAIFAAFGPHELTELIRYIVPGNIKAKADLVLFTQWLPAATIADGEEDESSRMVEDAMQAG